VGVGIDISERKRAEVALRDSRARLVEAQRIAGIGSWVLDIADDRVSASDQTWVICEREGAEEALAWARVLDLVHADDRARLDSAKRAMVAGGDPMNLELRLVLSQGREKVVHVLGDLKRDAEGHPLLISGTLHDITARVRLAAEFERRERAEAADRVKSAFLATMSHELRTPLNSIIGFTGILLQGLAGPTNDEQNTQLGMVRASARHLLALVNDVLDISKIEAGQLEIAALPFDVRKAIDKAVGLIEPQVKHKQLVLRLALEPELGIVVGDERRFQQILINLLSNAVKFTEQGEIVLRTQRLASPDRLRLQVVDTGIGIMASDIPSLFQPFRQIDDGLARQHEGTGLGLAICQRLAGLMGGTISVDSAWGAGSTFTLELALEKVPSP
jgi:signal transduction histidine kinase